MIRFAIVLLLAACTSVEPDVRKNTAPECANDSDCSGGASCRNGICEAPRGSLRCVSDSECPAGHGELLPSEAGYIECTSFRKLGDQKAEVLLARLDSARHAHHEIEMRGQRDDALLREAEAGFDVAHVVALQLVADLFFAHPPR